jgi:cation transport regulator
MPYRTDADLPPAVRRHLPPHAQNIYREAFNSAFAAHIGDQRPEEASDRLGSGQAILRQSRRRLDCSQSWPLTRLTAGIEQRSAPQRVAPLHLI